MATKTLTLIADVSEISGKESPFPPYFRLAYTSEKHLDQLASLYLAAYGVGLVTDLATAQKEMKDMFKGEFGELWPEASPMVLYREQLVAALFTVHKAPWDLTPTCPFIIDLMVDAAYRRKGFAVHLVRYAIDVVRQSDIDHVALRVLADNTPAISLYERLGFVSWDGIICAPA